MKGKVNPFANLMKVMATPSSNNTSPTPTPTGSGCSSPVKQMENLFERTAAVDFDGLGGGRCVGATGCCHYLHQISKKVNFAFQNLTNFVSPN